MPKGSVLFNFHICLYDIMTAQSTLSLLIGFTSYSYSTVYMYFNTVCHKNIYL